MSRKLAAGAEGVVVDIKWGKGSFIKDAEDAKQLARSLTRVGRTLKRRCVALVTDNNQPLGTCVGPSLELKEAIELLKGEGPEDLQDLVMKLGMEIVRLAGVAGSTLSAKQTVRKHLEDGSALRNFKDVIEYQGGDRKVLDDPEKLPRPNTPRNYLLLSVDMFIPSTLANSPKEYKFWFMAKMVRNLILPAEWLSFVKSAHR